MIRAYAAFSWFETKLFFREFTAIFFTLVVPAVISISVVARRESDAEVVEIFQGYMPEIAAVLATIVAMFVLAGNLVLNRERGFYKRILAAPVGPDMVAASTVTRGLIVVFVAVTEMLLICLAFGKALPSFNVPGFVLATMLSCGALFVLGFTLASFVPRSSTMFVVSNIAAQILVFTSELGLNFIDAPAEVRPIANLNPLTHAVRLMSHGWDGTLFSGGGLVSAAVLVAITMVGMLIVRKIFTWTT